MWGLIGWALFALLTCSLFTSGLLLAGLGLASGDERAPGDTTGDVVAVIGLAMLGLSGFLLIWAL